MASYPELRGRAAIVTGVGRAGSIGVAIATALAEQGVAVACVDIDSDAAAGAAERIAALGGRSLALIGDVTQEAAIDEFVAEATSAFGAPDILVNNAGGFEYLVAAGDISPDEWRRVLDLNLTSVFLCSRAVLPNMAARGSGRIVNISSLAGRPPTVSVPVHYAAAKAGVISLTQYLAREVGPWGVTVNAVAPGTTATPRVLRLRGETIEQDLVPRVPLRRLGLPDDHAHAVLFLVSDGASYITGATVDVNGGLGMT